MLRGEEHSSSSGSPRQSLKLIDWTVVCPLPVLGMRYRLLFLRPHAKMACLVRPALVKLYLLKSVRVSEIDTSCALGTKFAERPLQFLCGCPWSIAEATVSSENTNWRATT